MAKLRLATIGAWGHFPQVFDEIEGQIEFEVVALAKALPDDDLGVYRRFASTEKSVLYDDYELMLREKKPDVVIISTRLDRINPIAIEAAGAGCHLICEKPLALAHESLEQLFEMVRQRGVQCIAMLNNPAHPVIRATRQLYRDGTLGEIVLLNARKSYKWGDRPLWFGQRATYGSTIGWVGIHALDIIQAVTGQHFTSVAAMHSNCVHPERPDCQDNVAMILGLHGGAHATVSVDLLRPDAAPTHGDDWLRIVGSRAVAEASLDRNCLALISSHHSEHLVSISGPGSYYLKFLEDVVIGPGVLLEESRKAFELTHVCLKSWDAASSGQVIAIEPGPWRASESA